MDASNYEGYEYTGHFCYYCGFRLVKKWFGDLLTEVCPLCMKDKGD